MLSEKEQRSDAARFWEFIKTNLKTLVIYAALGGITAFVITFFVPKEYKSYGMVYPPSSTSIDNSIDFPNFGYDVEADRLVQIFQSGPVKDSMIKKFDLATYYEIDKTAPEWMDNLMKKYYKDIKFERTSSMSVLITARSKDAKLSAAMVNYIIHLADGLRENIYKKNIITAYENARADYDTQKRQVDSVEVILLEKLKQNNLSSLLMLISDAQISIDLEKLNAVNTSTSGATIGADIIAFKSMYEVLKEYKARFLKVKKTFANPIPRLYVINYGEPNYKKISPSFTVNVTVGILFALFVAIVVLLLKHTSEKD
jgi:capsular polysaccharide biosynthesis protein